jgi:zinc protease
MTRMTAASKAIQARAATIDGVPALWVPGEGKFTAGLTFRVGMADETLAISGITHLIEHLTLYPIGRDGAPVRFHGQVDDLTTTFVATGAPADVAVFLEQVCRHLHALDPARLPAEREILKLEAGSHHGGDGAALRYWRFGPRTYGRKPRIRGRLTPRRTTFDRS